MKENCLVIFDTGLEPLGEVHFKEGACSQVNLNRKGEMLLGPFVSDWQVTGLPQSKAVTLRLDGLVAKAWSLEKAKMSSSNFESALASWLDGNGYHHLSIPVGAMAAFSQIQEMDLPNEKKYELAVILRELPVEKIEAVL